MRAIFLAAAALMLSACTSKAADSAAQPQQAEASAAADPVIELAPGQTIAPVPGKLVVIDFNADWCGPCKRFAPAFHAVARQFADRAVFYSVNVDNHRQLAAEYGASSIPMVVYMQPDGTGTYTTGLIPEDEFAKIVASQLPE